VVLTALVFWALYLTVAAFLIVGMSCDPATKLIDWIIVLTGVVLVGFVLFSGTVAAFSSNPSRIYIERTGTWERGGDK
jgi:hypothetical protein